MYTIQFGLFPLTGIALAGLLYGLYYFVLRMKCKPRYSQTYIMITICSVVVFTLLSPARITSVDEATDRNVRQSESAFLQLLEGEPMPSVQNAFPSAELGSALEDMPEANCREADRTDMEGVQPPSGEPERTVDILWAIYWAGVLMVFLHFVCQLCWLFHVCRKHTLTTVEDGMKIYSTDYKQPFSFGRNIFVPGNISDEIRRYVLMHEKGHVNHLHFVKLCMVEILISFVWFNVFVWLLFNELKLQQEFEVDDDVVASGCDRQEYQMSLLRICVQSGRWILVQSSFGYRPLKARIVFMNNVFERNVVRRRMAVSSVMLAFALSVAFMFGCHTREEAQYISSPLEGCWTMDWIRNADEKYENRPVYMHYKFYHNNMTTCYSYFRRYGKNMNFNISAESYSYKNDTVYNAKGEPIDYKFISDDTYIFNWIKDSLQLALVSGPEITEQWTRIEPDADIVQVFKAVYAARSGGSHPFNGVWHQEVDDALDKYLIVNEGIFLYLEYSHAEKKYYRFGGRGKCGEVESVSPDSMRLFDVPDVVRLQDDSHITLYGTIWERALLPDRIRRAFGVVTANPV